MRRLESILVKTKTFKMFVMSLKCVLFMSNNNDSSHFTHCMRSTHLLTISSQAALSEADCTASRSDRLMNCKSFLTTSIHLRRGRPRGRRMSVVLIDIRRAWNEDDSSPSLTTWPNHSSLRCLQT